MRRREVIGNLIIFSPLLLFIIASLSASFVWQSPKGYFYLSMVLLMSGFILILKAKIPHFKDGRFITFGTKGMTKSNIKFYLSGVFLAGIGTIMTLGLLFIVLIKGP
jgi:hypothetical protein